MGSVRFELEGELVIPSLEQVMAIHEFALIEGGRPGVLNTGAIEGALGRPTNAHQYSDERDLITLAAYLWHGISSAHGFTDGNKRTALLTCFAFLEANGLEFSPEGEEHEPGEFVDLCYEENRFTIPILDHYLRTRCQWIVDE